MLKFTHVDRDDDLLAVTDLSERLAFRSERSLASQYVTVHLDRVAVTRLYRVLGAWLGVEVPKAPDSPLLDAIRTYGVRIVEAPAPSSPEDRIAALIADVARLLVEDPRLAFEGGRAIRRLEEARESVALMERS